MSTWENKTSAEIFTADRMAYEQRRQGELEAYRDMIFQEQGWWMTGEGYDPDRRPPLRKGDEKS